MPMSTIAAPVELTSTYFWLPYAGKPCASSGFNFRVKVTGAPLTDVEYVWLFGLLIRNWFAAVEPNRAQSFDCPPVLTSIGMTPLVDGGGTGPPGVDASAGNTTNNITATSTAPVANAPPSRSVETRNGLLTAGPP